MNKEVIIDIENPKDNDVISRQAVINIVKLRWDYYKNCIEAIEKLPSITQKSGKWIEHEDECECPFCHKTWNYCDNDTETFNCCPNCGAKMVEPQESEDKYGNI